MKDKFLNIYTLVSLILGFFICYLFFLLSKKLKISTDNIITLTSIFINLIIAGFIALFLQKKYIDDRELKNYLINELKLIQSDYNKFSNKLLKDKVNGESVTSWFKIMNIKLNHIKFFLNSEFDIDDNRLNKFVQDMRIYITNSDSFNNTFSKKNIVLAQSLKNQLLESTKTFNHTIHSVIVNIHKK